MTRTAASARGRARVPAAPAPRRVRDQARETLALMAFSASCSVGISLTFVLLASLGR